MGRIFETILGIRHKQMRGVQHQNMTFIGVSALYRIPAGKGIKILFIIFINIHLSDKLLTACRKRVDLIPFFGSAVHFAMFVDLGWN